MVACLVLVLSSCRNLYVQKNVFVPLLKEKGELKVEGNLSREVVSLNSAYAFSNQFSVMLNGSSALDNSAQYKRKYSYQGEVALGYFKTFRDSIHFESHVGFTQGIFDTDFDRLTGELKSIDESLLYVLFGMNTYLLFLDGKSVPVNATGSYRSAFLQNSISILSSKTSTTLTARAQYVQFNNYREEGNFNGQQAWYYINIAPRLFLQPVITNKVELFRNVNMVGQFGFNIPLFEGNNYKEAFEWNKFFCSVGVEVKLNTQKWRR
jgi:hypothetical protein